MPSKKSAKPREKRGRDWDEHRRRAAILERLWRARAESPAPRRPAKDVKWVNDTFIENQEFLDLFNCALPTLLADYQFLLHPPPLEPQRGGIQLRERHSYFGEQATKADDVKLMLGWATAWYLSRRETQTGSCSILQGTTLWNVAIALRFQEFQERTFYVLTNSPPAFAALMGNEKIPLIASGGDHRRSINALTGKLAADTFRRFGPTHVLIGVSGLEDLVVYQADGHEIAVSEAAVQSVEGRGELIVVADARKFGKRDHWEVCDLRQTQFKSLVFVTDRSPQEFPVEHGLAAHTVRLIQVSPKITGPDEAAARLFVLESGGRWKPSGEEFRLPPVRKLLREHRQIARVNQD